MRGRESTRRSRWRASSWSSSRPRAQEQAIKRADAGDFDGAREVLNEAAERLGEHEVHMFSASYSPEARKEIWYDRHATRRGRPRKRHPKDQL